MDVKGKQLFNKSKLRTGTKTYVEQNFFSLYSQIEKLGFSAPLSDMPKDTTSELTGLFSTLCQARSVK